MCVIYACATALPPEDELHQGAWRNDHGAGICWVNKQKKRVEWVKGLKDEKAILEQIEKRKIPFPLGIHFRIASAGGKSPELTHPFPVSEDVPLWLAGSAGTVLMHNGHISKWEELVLAAGMANQVTFPEGDWSDTRALAWLVHLKGPGVVRFVNNSSRIMLLHNVPQYEVEEGKEPDPWDYFSFWGDWVGDREAGWVASTTTQYANRGGSRVWTREDGWEVADDEPTLPTAATAASSAAVQVDANVWSLTELHNVINQLKKELADARAKAKL
jgi:hypothetical protein